MRVDILTIFPQLFDGFLSVGMVERARRAGKLEVRLTNLRACTDDRHRSVDDRPYGGGPGMLLRPEPVFHALDLNYGAVASATKPKLLIMCPQGEVLSQPKLAQLAAEPELVILCGRYEGYDERILQNFDWERVSLGEFVLSGGEIPAMALIEGVSRLLPGVLGHDESAVRDSFSEWDGSLDLDHPHYTRPIDYRGMAVPEVLRSGHHGNIEKWRRQQSAIASANATERRRRNAEAE